MNVNSEKTDKNQQRSEADTSSKFAAKTLQDYEVISVIGNGSFGTCYKVRDKETGELYAWKGMDYDELSDSKKESLVSEISVLRRLQHPNIVQYYHHLVNHEAKSIYIVMECCEGGDLAQLIAKARAERRRFEEKYVWRVLFQTCRALQVCHNKLKQGTVLHRDIKPANIFLDAEGNAKLGDFGLARMLRRDESFADTFVGTPYYMSPEIVKGTKYDCKSDVWAVGCLIYEMCALRPPFKGREFEQLSANISNGKFSNIPEVYSGDLREIIAFMLEVENEQRPSIEVISRHPTVVRNINNMSNELFPQLIEAEESFYVPSDGEAWDKLDCSTDFSSTRFTEQNSFNEGYGQQRLSVSGVFTPDLRAELFYSARRRIFAKPTLQRSDPMLYESIQRADIYAATGNDMTLKPVTKQLPKVQPTTAVSAERCGQAVKRSPSLLTHNIFEKVLHERLHAIRAQEFLLSRREASLNAREQQLNEKEKRLQDLEEILALKANASMKSPTATTVITSLPSSLERRRMPLPTEANSAPAAPQPPPVPPRRSTKTADSTYCSIEPNDTLLQQPTVAKLNLATLPAAKVFPSLRKVTFQSPKKFIKYDIENVAPKAMTTTMAAPTSFKLAQPTKMRASVSSKGSDDSADSTTQRRKSMLLSIFGLNRGKAAATTTKKIVNADTCAATTKARLPFTLKEKDQPQPEQVLAKCETVELNNIWTKEHKRAAFDMLAAMNAAVDQQQHQRQVPNLANARHKLRQSVRDRNTLHRNRLRRSLIVAPPQQQQQSIIGAVGRGREQLVI